MSLLAIAGCGPKWSAQELAAIDACLNAAVESFPRIDPTASEIVTEDQMGDLDQAEFASAGNGDFVFRYPNSAAELGDAFVCRGNLTARHVEQIDSGRFVTRGENNAGWSY